MRYHHSSKLPTLAEISRAGWKKIYEKLDDRWSDKDRIKSQINAGVHRVEFIRYGQTSHITRPVIANHGGPLGQINEGWRYLVDPKYFNILLPRQYDSGLLAHSADEAIHESGGLIGICDALYLFQKSVAPGKIVLTGSSWGATVSLAYAASYPELVEAVVIASPFIPTGRSIEHLISPEGGFSGNEELRQYFLDGLEGGPYRTAPDIFQAYYYRLAEKTSDFDYLRHFSALFYSAMGDFGKNIKVSQLPTEGFDLERAIGFSYLAGMKKPFLFDEAAFSKGLRALKTHSVPIHIIHCADDRSSSVSDLRILHENSGAHLVRVPGGHSSPDAKFRVHKLINCLGARLT